MHQCFFNSINKYSHYLRKPGTVFLSVEWTGGYLRRGGKAARKLGTERGIREKERESGWKNREREMNAQTHVFYSIKFSIVTRA